MSAEFEITSVISGSKESRDVLSAGQSLTMNITDGIAASDLSSLLEQFEQVESSLLEGSTDIYHQENIYSSIISHANTQQSLNQSTVNESHLNIKNDIETSQRNEGNDSFNEMDYTTELFSLGLMDEQALQLQKSMIADKQEKNVDILEDIVRSDVTTIPVSNITAENKSTCLSNSLGTRHSRQSFTNLNNKQEPNESLIYAAQNSSNKSVKNKFNIDHVNSKIVDNNRNLIKTVASRNDVNFGCENTISADIRHQSKIDQINEIDNMGDLPSSVALNEGNVAEVAQETGLTGGAVREEEELSSELQWDFDPWAEFREAAYGAPVPELVNPKLALSTCPKKSKQKKSDELGKTDISSSVFFGESGNTAPMCDMMDDNIGALDGSEGMFVMRSEECRKRGLFGPHRQKPRRKRESESMEEKYYDRLPSYYTVFSLPNRTATGVKVAATTLPNSTATSTVTSSDPGSDCYDKMPSYYSCFTNSTVFDEESGNNSSAFSGANLLGFTDKVAASKDMQDTVETFGNAAVEPYRSPSGYSGERVRPHSPQYTVDLFKPRLRSHRRGRAACLAASAGASSSLNPPVVFQSDFIRSPRRRYSVRGSREVRHQDKVRERFEKRHIVYIGRIPNGYTNDRLKCEFGTFGEIEKSSVHFREMGDNYAFVTYKFMSSAIEANEKGNQLPGCENFDICFGGRRKFCDTDYTDLDGRVQGESDQLSSYCKKAPTAKAAASSRGSAAAAPPSDYEQLLIEAKLRASATYKPLTLTDSETDSDDHT